MDLVKKISQPQIPKLCNPFWYNTPSWVPPLYLANSSASKLTLPETGFSSPWASQVTLVVKNPPANAGDG